VSLLVDRHVLIWTALDPKRLSKAATRAIERASSHGGISIASISLWEIAMLAQQRRVAIRGTIANWLTELLTTSGVSVLDLSPSIAELSTSFGPDYPKDPADRIIGATAKQHAMPLVTADSRLLGSGQVSCIW
jgi:PIN domain nuclease of toxin-antitoxin system